MAYSIRIDNGSTTVLLDGRAVLSDIRFTVTDNRQVSENIIPTSVESKDNEFLLSFEKQGMVDGAQLKLREVGSVLQFELEIETHHIDISRYLSSNAAVRMHFKPAYPLEGDYITGTEQNLWFQIPSFSNDFEKLPRRTQDVHFKMDGRHIHMLPLVGGSWRAELEGDALVTSIGCGGIYKAHGPIMTLSVSDDPYSAIKENFRAGRQTGVISVPLREERSFPEAFRYFGWCTWDAFYHDVTSEKIYGKLDEFKSVGIIPSYVLIDDGWSCYTEDGGLLDFCEDRKKFPEGLAACIRKIKEEYGVKYVGVWHAFGGYWRGIAQGSELAERMSDTLVRCKNGYLVPAPDADKSFAFWDVWHSYLEEQGVDFVKVDVQSSYSHFVDELCENAQAVRNAHEGLERSVFKHFDGRIINCMGMDIADLLGRPMSAINRNSNDFYPNRENSFVSHIYMNAYNAPTHGAVMYCDYDMWWSQHESARQGSVLRAISGGPVYVSDEVGKTDATYIRPLIDKNGMIPKLDGHAVPTLDCFYLDTAANGVPLKLFNRSGENFAVAAFGLTDGAVGTLRLEQIPNAEGEYLACEYFTGEQTVMTAETEISFKLDRNECKLWNLYPIRSGEALVGDADVFMGCASINKKAVKVK